MVKLSGFITLLTVISQICVSYCSFYPIIFIHDHGSTLFDVENSWTYLIERKLNTESYMHAGMIWSSTLNSWENGSLPCRSMFQFGFYRDNINQGFQQNSCINCKYRSRTYVAKLAQAVDDILRVTNCSKAHIVAHGMGGLIARSYISSKNNFKIAKLLLVGVPNYGLPDDCKLEMEKRENSQLYWQEDGEYAEMMKGSPFMKTLDQNLDNIATIRGIYGSSSQHGPFLSNDDGWIKENDVKMPVSLFNGLVYASHDQKRYIPFRVKIQADREGTLITSTYTSEVIKQWLIGNTISRCGAAKFDNQTTSLIIKQGVGLVAIYDLFYQFDSKSTKQNLQWVASIGMSVSMGASYKMPHFSRYYAHDVRVYVTVYGFDGICYKTLTTVNKSAIPMPAIKLSLIDYPRKITRSSSANFSVSPTCNELRYIIDHEISQSYVNETIALDNLSPGLHTIHIMCHDLPCTSDLQYIWFIDKGNASDKRMLVNRRRRHFQETFDSYNYGPIAYQGPWSGVDTRVSQYEPQIHIRNQVKANREVVATGGTQILRANYSFIFSSHSNNSYIQFSCYANPNGECLIRFTLNGMKVRFGLTRRLCRYSGQYCGKLFINTDSNQSVSTQISGNFSYDIRIIMNWKISQFCIQMKRRYQLGWSVYSFANVCTSNINLRIDNDYISVKDFQLELNDSIIDDLIMNS